VYIIDEVHMLSQGAFNALLKTLEEPPSYAIFILATTEKHKVLPTILSRCQVYDFSRITVADTIHHLQYVARQEGITASEEALNVVAQKADGGMRDALSIFDQLVSFCGTQISYEQAIEVLNVLDTDYYFRLVNAALVGNVSEALLLLNEVLTKGFDAGNFVTGFAQHLRDVLVSKDVATLPLLETSDVIRQHYQEQAQRCAAKWLFNALDIVNTCDINYRTAKNKRLTVELALVKLCRLTEAPAQEVQRVQNTGVQATTPAAQPAPRPATAPQPTAVVQPAVAPKPATPTAPPPPKPTSLGAMPSLGNLGKLSATPQATAQPTAAAPTTEQQKRNNPFTLDQLKSAWVGQIKYFEKEERFKAMLTTYELIQDSETKFHITVDNQLQKKEFAKFGKQLMDRVRDVLQNDDVQLRVEVAEYTAAQVAYTSTEKYKILNQLNPHLEELRQRMNLQIE
jgi:DNA polymerase-3 subunit gamma/tau